MKGKSESHPVHVTTHSQSKVTLQGVQSEPNAPHKSVYVPKSTTNISNQYNLLEQLKKTPAQISILELLCLSPSHKDILEKALLETQVPTNLDHDQFQAMVGHLTTPHYLSFTENDDLAITQPHNAPLHIEVLV